MTLTTAKKIKYRKCRSPLFRQPMHMLLCRRQRNISKMFEWNMKNKNLYKMRAHAPSIYVYFVNSVFSRFFVTIISVFWCFVCFRSENLNKTCAMCIYIAIIFGSFHFPLCLDSLLGGCVYTKRNSRTCWANYSERVPIQSRNIFMICTIFGAYWSIDSFVDVTRWFGPIKLFKFLDRSPTHISVRKRFGQKNILCQKNLIKVQSRQRMNPLAHTCSMAFENISILSMENR